MKWYVVPLLTMVGYAWFKELDKGNLSRVLGALAFLGVDLFNETWNSLVMHLSGFAPVWGTHGPSAYQLLIGWNIEIVFGFALTGLMATMMLPKDPKLKIFGINNRILFIVMNSIGCVFIEIMLNQAGLLVWEWAWWSAKAPWLIFLVGYVPFFAACYWIYDMDSRKKQFMGLGAIYGVNAVFITSMALNGWV
ncbi:hypothetical protein DC094_09900 [Pelagibaculum spongiae]|uniref:Carotenoid biosynthesis protein n=2 Tax=Pelagibaculum spongiae TaxID=2080658 RepID=A0A2V1GUB9_9GAMM|nr:hypothetical protein DC094_09900 [Pelagibaculum spongiae]